jgi:hypothetical protein
VAKGADGPVDPIPGQGSTFAFTLALSVEKHVAAA